MTDKKSNSDTDLIKQSLIDADYVKEMAINNAKTLLEGQLNEKLKKLMESQQNEDEEDDSINEDKDSKDTSDIISESDSELNEDEELDLFIEEDEDEDEEDSKKDKKKKDVKEEDDDEDSEEEDDEEEDSKKDKKKKDVKEEEDSEEDDDEDEDDEEDDSSLDEDIDLSEILDDSDDIKFSDLNEEDDDEEDDDEDEDDEEEDEDMKENASLKTENKSLKKKLKEYREGFEKVNTKLSEYVILNTKLIYANKLFKEYELDQDQKYKIISRLDEGNTKREIKLIYETIQSSFETSNMKIKEDVSFASDVKNFDRSNEDKNSDILDESEVNDKITKRFKHLAYYK